MKKALRRKGRWLILIVGFLFLPLFLYGIRELPHWWHYYSLEREGKWRSSIRLDGTYALSSGDIVYDLHITNEGTATWGKDISLGTCERAGNSSLGWRQAPPAAQIVGTNGQVLEKNGDRKPFAFPHPIAPAETFPLLMMIHPADRQTTLFFQLVDDHSGGVGWFGEEISLQIEGRRDKK